MKSIVKPELVIIAEHEGEVAGFILSIPDVNQALKRANGRLFPFGLIKLMLGMRKIDKIKTFMMGVLPKYRKKGLETVFILETFERAVKMGYKEADCSLIVENNHIMINTLAHIGAQKYKTYRHFSKPITL
jgi:GNAT superfamily N-acetyltransferase